MIASRYAAPAYVEFDADMTAAQITIVKARNKTRKDWMIAEQNLKRAIMDSVGLTIRRIFPPSPLSFQNMTSSKSSTTRTARRLDEILAEKFDNVRNVHNAAQWSTHALSFSFNDEGLQVIAQRYAAPAYVELDAGMSATEITISKARKKTREDCMIAEQNLKRAIMDSVGLTIRHIIAPPPLFFQNMTPIDDI